MKLSEFKAQYLPWSKEYKLREKKEAELQDAWRRQHAAAVAAQQQQLMGIAKEQIKINNRRKAPEPLVKQVPPTVQSSSSTFGDALLGSLVGNVIGNAISSHSSSDSSSSSSYSSSSDSDSSSSWSDSSSSSWSDSGSSSWD